MACAETHRSLARKAAADTRFLRVRYSLPLHARLPTPLAFADFLFPLDRPVPPDRTASEESQSRCRPGRRRGQWPIVGSPRVARGSAALARPLGWRGAGQQKAPMRPSSVQCTAEATCRTSDSSCSMASWGERASGSSAVASEKAVSTGLGGTGRSLERLPAPDSAHSANRAVDSNSAYGKTATADTTNPPPASRSILATEGAP